jgi:hypothetical protein
MRVQAVIRGVVGLTKVALSIDKADDAVIESRRAICQACRPDKGVCDKCGCLIAAKTRLKGEQCPIGKW